MILFLVISFIAGVLTVLAPCTLPLLPVIVGSAVSGEENKVHLKKALVISLSLGVSVIIFTIILKISTLFVNIPSSVWSVVSGVIIIVFGFVSLFPELWERIPLVAKLNVRSNKLVSVGYKKQSFAGDMLIGASLGPVFTTCSPTYFIILATVLPQSFLFGFLCLVVYAVGLSGVLLLVAFLGQKLVNKIGGLTDTHGWFKKALGIFFIIIGIAVIFGVDKRIETALLESNVPDITKIEQKLLTLADTSKETQGTPAPEFVHPDGYINTGGEPITIGQFKGDKIILLDVWTYSCINCQRTIPYLVAWDKKYRDLGLQIIGVHTPEFAFEKVQSNVEKAVKGFGIEYPVVLDNEYATWNAYGNNYWPRKYLINKDGVIVYDHIGEGSYEQTERAIQKSLMELNLAKGKRVAIPMDIVDPKGAVDMSQSKVKSPEIYFGAERNGGFFGEGKTGQTGKQSFVIPAQMLPNKVYFEGTWDIHDEEVENITAGKIVLTYNAKNVYMVASSKLPSGATVTIKKDGHVEKTLIIKDNVLYTLIEGSEYGQHVLEIDIPEAGMQAFTFTFG